VEPQVSQLAEGLDSVGEAGTAGGEPVDFEAASEELVGMRGDGGGEVQVGVARPTFSRGS
jgi:hypothetical protein